MNRESFGRKQSWPIDGHYMPHQNLPVGNDNSRSQFNDIDNDAGDLADPVSFGPTTYRILKFIVGSFGLQSVLLTKGGVLGSCYRIWE